MRPGELAVGSPVAGTAVPITEVEDPVFADAMVGPGMAIRPNGGYGDAVAPVAGTVATLHPHAFVVAGEDGRAVLVHLGIDTVKQHGAGFTVHVAKGDTVEAGQSIVGWDPDVVAAAGYSAIVPVVALDASAQVLGDLLESGDVTAGGRVFTWAAPEQNG